ncbi:hypothetical protein VCHENC02_1222A, partial [Vibrio harveyi]
MSLYWFSLVSS